MTDLEKALFSEMEQAEFTAACQAAFSGQSGVILKNALLKISHPFYPPVGADALETYRNIGRGEVVSLLLRHSEAVVPLAILTTTNDDDN